MQAGVRRGTGQSAAVNSAGRPDATAGDASGSVDFAPVPELFRLTARAPDPLPTGP